MTIHIDRDFGFEIYFIVKTWRPIYRHFNRVFCNCRRPISFVITNWSSF